MDSLDKTVSDRSTDEARQGVTGHNVRYVLAAGLIGTVAMFGVIALAF